jgi:tetratricopeptide (TPR) repeat protein
MLTAAAIFSLALVIRLLNLQQLHANDPFFALPSPDPRLYHEWALRIASGELLGEGVFLQGPLYPYLLAMVYRIFGPGFLLPRLLQCVLGALSCVLTWAVARELFDRRVAAVAGFGAALYAMSVFYEGSLLIANILVPLNLWLLLAALRAMEAPTLRGWLGVGLIAGLSALARPNMLLFPPLVVLWMGWGLPERYAWGRRVRWMAVFLVGVSLCVGVSALRNYVVAGDPVLVSASAGMNFFNGNNPAANGMHKVPPLFDRTQADDPVEQNRIYKAVAERAAGRTLLASEVSSFWLAQGLQYARASPAAWLQLLGRKLLLFLNAFEAWNNRSYAVSSQFSWVLRLPLLGFGVVLPLALLGLGLSARHWRRLVPAYALLIVYLATSVLFFVLSRYRHPLLPLLLIFAAHAVVWIVDRLRQRQWVLLSLALAALVPAAALANWEIEEADLSVAYYNLGNKYLALEQFELATLQYEKSLEINPGYISANNNYALALEKTGTRWADAVAAWQRVLEMGERRQLPRYSEIATRHLDQLAEMGPGSYEPQ